ncbi:DUF4865 family protein [Amycolatopsis benzoatilytica]|uniref:DUF4865 family protein n=1 Tax=Amycolatopsis benzoatilytica TaxID=346045 RepID=UPI00036CFE72|nr:DUF4865 family protein [Amycolatopsis benzoatilytica]
MQYEINLPADYDMEIIRERVATRGHRTDEFPGLALKAYLIRTPANQYAPFYLWADTAGMSRFLWGGGGFDGIVQDFGRPSVQHWTGANCLAGPARGATPTFATKRRQLLPEGRLKHELAEFPRHAEHPAVHTTALAIDPRRWEAVHFTLWTADPGEDNGVRYQVLHLSRPHLDQLS